MAEELETGIIQDKSKHLQTYLGILADEIKLRPTETKLLDEYNQKQVEYIKLQTDYSLRIASKLATAEDKANKKELIELTDQEIEKEHALVVTRQEAMRKDYDRLQGENPFVWKVSDQVAAVHYSDKVKENIENIRNITDKADAQRIDDQKKAAHEILKVEEEMATRKINIISSITNLIGAFQTKNKTIQKAQLITEKAGAIAEIIIRNSMANTVLRSNAAASVLPGPLYLARLAAAQALVSAPISLNNIIAGINIAAIVAATASGLAGFSKGGKINRGIPVDTGTVDNRLIAVNNTETVLTARHVAMLGGSGVMRQIGVPGYAMGGYIGSQTPTILPTSNRDMIDAINARIDRIEVYNDVNKLISALNEHTIINTSNRI
jgi:hypothetical protein